MNITGFGRDVAINNLREHGYECSVFYRVGMLIHIVAYKNGQKYLISVVPRNHTNSDGTLKVDGYNLHDNKRKGGGTLTELARKVAWEQHAALAWLTVRINADDQIYDCYFGLVGDLDNPNLIPMDEEDRRDHNKLCENRHDARIKHEWSNVQSNKTEK
jgi:hypothetical protein